MKISCVFRKHVQKHGFSTRLATKASQNTVVAAGPALLAGCCCNESTAKTRSQDINFCRTHEIKQNVSLLKILGVPLLMEDLKIDSSVWLFQAIPQKGTNNAGVLATRSRF